MFSTTLHPRTPISAKNDVLWFKTLNMRFPAPSILENDFRVWIYSFGPPHQFGFQQSLGCDHVIYSLVSILVGTESNNDFLVLAGQDLACAFESSICEQILLLAAHKGIQGCVIKPFYSMYSSLQVIIKCPNLNCDILVESDIPVKKGIRQGVVSLSDMFNNSVIEVQYKALTKNTFPGHTLAFRLHSLRKVCCA